MNKRRIYVAVTLIGVSAISAYVLYHQNKVKQIAPQHTDYSFSEGVS
jgi:hypothetical protein